MLENISLLACLLYSDVVSDIELGELYRVNKLKGKVKRFKYKLKIVSNYYDHMELHLDLNSEKLVAQYTIQGRRTDGEWVSVLSQLETGVRKVMKDMR